jgi:cephalosporin hydroxylase
MISFFKLFYILTVSFLTLKILMHINILRKKFLPKQEISKTKNYSYLLNLLMDTKYVYHFNWLGVPIIQFPSDLVVLQEIIFKYKPDFIIESGIAHGGSLLFYSSILSAIKKKFSIIGIDIKIKSSNKKKIFSMPLSKHIKLFQSSSTNLKMFEKIKKATLGKKVIVILDSNHSHKHVLKELEMYSQLIKKNGYIIVQDTNIEFIKKKHINKGRDFGPGNSPYTAVQKFIKQNSEFQIDKLYENKALITCSIGGFLKKK